MVEPNPQVLWFKRDLRVHDHEALMRAVAAGPVLPIYILEPDLWAQPDMSLRHFQFLRGSLMSLSQALSALGMQLITKIGDVACVLSELYEECPFTALWSHYETWNQWARERDLRVSQWCDEHGVSWHQPRQNGVLTRAENRASWNRKWQRFMRSQTAPAPAVEQVQALPARAMTITSVSLPSPLAWGLTLDQPCQLLPSGRYAGIEMLNDFLTYRCQYYLEQLATPLTSQATCSRLSVYLSFGLLSIREVYQQVQQRLCLLRQDDALLCEDRQIWIKSLRAFSHRLRWHCQFIQKLEDQPSIEHHNLHSGYNGLRLTPNNKLAAQRLTAWETGQTGYPLIDAGMRALIATGWLNFRLRALLISFAGFHLWLDWRAPALHLARLFTDYEPGVHYNQIQMQLGTTGLTTLRIDDPVEKSQLLDDEGIFIRQWIPELAQVPDDMIHTPWLMSEPPVCYPGPIVPERQTRQTAYETIQQLRRTPTYVEEKERLLAKHSALQGGEPRGA